MKRLLIVRHGDTFAPGEPPRRIGAGTDLPLTPRGEAQAGAVAAWLLAHGRSPDLALTGPLQRATRTARLILAALPRACPLEQAAWLNEVDYGPDEGLPEDDVVARVGTGALTGWDRQGEPAPGWPVDRAAKIAECGNAVAALPDGTTLLVTSNGTARFMLIALGLAAAAPSLKLRTGAIGEIEIVGGDARLCGWDRRLDA